MLRMSKAETANLTNRCRAKISSECWDWTKVYETR